MLTDLQRQLAALDRRIAEHRTALERELRPLLDERQRLRDVIAAHPASRAPWLRFVGPGLRAGRLRELLTRITAIEAVDDAVVFRLDDGPRYGLFTPELHEPVVTPWSVEAGPDPRGWEDVESLAADQLLDDEEGDEVAEDLLAAPAHVAVARILSPHLDKGRAG